MARGGGPLGAGCVHLADVASMMWRLRYLLDDMRIMNKELDDPMLQDPWLRRYHNFRAETQRLIKDMVNEQRCDMTELEAALYRVMMAYVTRLNVNRSKHQQIVLLHQQVVLLNKGE